MSHAIPNTMHTVSFDWFLSGLEWILKQNTKLIHSKPDRNQSKLTVCNVDWQKAHHSVINKVAEENSSNDRI